MRKIIQLVRPSIATDGVLIRGSLLQNNARANDLIRHARRRAHQIVDDAQKQAAETMRVASAQGYADGLVAVAEELARYLAAHVELAERIRSATVERTTALLRDCLGRPDVIAAAMLDALPAREDGLGRAELLLPRKLGDMDALVEQFQARFGDAIAVQQWDGDAVLLRVGENVLELSIDAVAAEGAAQVMSAIPSIYAESDGIAAECRERLAAVLRGIGASKDAARKEKQR
ncbi:hypothetical protein K6W16_20000 [Burkholderia dolosa]|uniref:Oxygen-regulated invasion protein OrgB n=2 Tax=Pseudomonadota TaxID=1224 RepID=A0A892ID75_9BURK|nr:MULTISPECIES: HrpE/YscL family type III secretion apparatus protein [Burkholderia]AJY09297.1 hrpE/YscL/FliH and V-type ATPase subunit E family protein [Burkholderia dolosa AU0158]AYZ94371.1 hypothetical protein EGY28_04430 [Burkholderia dolosa]MBR8415779.1 hypothetical protein [Burkholderia dolosa]MBY4659576.1 hypothetical protein [Burkholderia dolosa]MBY4690702.1 hypothetical protein [Burkholderia dolosa]